MSTRQLSGKYPHGVDVVVERRPDPRLVLAPDQAACVAREVVRGELLRDVARSVQLVRGNTTVTDSSVDSVEVGEAVSAAVARSVGAVQVVVTAAIVDVPVRSHQQRAAAGANLSLQ